ncbi:MAG: type I restriction endonuclease subunit R [Candidatus Anstonellales archaeon]
MPRLNENTLTSQPVIEWLKEMGYDYEFGPDLAPGQITAERKDFREVILVDRLKRSIRRLNPELPDFAIDEAIDQLIKLEHPNLEIANKAIYQMLTQGIKLDVRDKDGKTKGRLIKVIDFENPLNNEFLVVDEFAIQGIERVRRPDIIIFINGIPIAIFELKSPIQESRTIESAFYQLQDYKKDIPEVFKYNQILVISDLIQARHGTVSSSWEWFSVWKKIENEEETIQGVSELETTVKGIFHKIRLLDIIENFIVFEADSEKNATKFTKKMCLYHQYFGVNKAVQETLRATAPSGNKKIGVFWHTQGSGKSLSMVFYVNKVKKLSSLNSPTFLFLTDRNDLDNQLYKTFLRSGYPTAKKAESINDLKAKLRTAGGELIFTTIQKFEGEEYEKLSDKENLLVIADEAHRSQYAKLAGNVRKAIPNASFMGITGTPISLENRDTQLVFGEYISIYQINQAVEDKATVPIYYEGRLIPLHLTNQFIDEEFDDLIAEQEFEIKESLKRKWARLEQAVGAKDRLKQVAEDIVSHFNNRGVEGKAMVVTMSRKIAVEMYKLISKIEGAPKAAVVISKPEDFKGEIQEELNNKELERQFKDPDSELKLVIVCDMWLTGFDVPPLQTMYIDKPLKNHTLMQAIARVNRIFKDKAGGLIVDYIGIADNLKKALSIYSSDIHKEAMIPLQEIVSKMLEKYDVVKSMFMKINYSNWKKLESGELTRLFQQAINMIITDEKTDKFDEEKKNRFLKESEILFRLFAFAMPNHEAIEIRNDVEFFQAVKKAIIKRTRTVGTGIDREKESAIKELISKSISAEGVIDIFDIKGKGKPDISIFDEKFIEEVRNMKYRNLAVEVLRKLLEDELRIRVRKNASRYKSLLELLENTIEEYENNIISSTKVIERLIELAKEIRMAEKAGENLGLSEEELAFYDIIVGGKKAINRNGEIKKIVKELLKIIKRDLSIDWTNNDIIKARIRADVRVLLLQNKFSVEESETLLESIFQQARLLYNDWVPSLNYANQT